MFNHQCPHHRNVWECQTGLISKSGFLPKSACYHYFSGSSGSGSMHSLGFLVRFSGRYKVVCAYSIRWNQNQPKLFPMIISIWDKLKQEIYKYKGRILTGSFIFITFPITFCLNFLLKF